jgi:flagellar basal-body rod protein FlgF
MRGTDVILLSGEEALQRSLDIIANNVANASTTAFKREGLSFNSYLSQGGASGSKKPLQLVVDKAAFRDPSNGPIKSTGNPLDLAISGEGYFAVQTASGATEYTRNGSFQLNNQGQMVTHSGEIVLGDGGQGITLPDTVSELNISGDGFITARIDNGKDLAQLGKLNFVKFDDEQSLQSVGNGLYTSNAATQPETDGQIIQGAIEGSNVEPIREMTSMIQVLRSYQQVINIITGEHDRTQQSQDKLAKTTV